MKVFCLLFLPLEISTFYLSGMQCPELHVYLLGKHDDKVKSVTDPIGNLQSPLLSATTH